jgi:hypothetical protein
VRFRAPPAGGVGVRSISLQFVVVVVVVVVLVVVVVIWLLLMGGWLVFLK